MKTIKPLTILLITCFQAQFIFPQTNAVLNYLPEDAKVIVKINPAELGKKMKWEEFTKTKMFDDIVKDMSDEAKKFFENPGPTGIDMTQGLFVIMPLSKTNKKTQPIVYGVPKDTTAFVAMVKRLAPKARRAKIGNGKLLIDKKTAFAWNNDIFLIAEDDSKDMPTYQPATSKVSDDVARTRRITERSKALLTRRKTPFANEPFQSLMKEQGDALLWINDVAQSSEKKSKAPKFVDIFNKNMRSSDYTTGVIRFENGQIDMQVRRYMPPSLDSLYKKYPAQNLNPNLVTKLPTGQPIALLSFRFSPAMFREMLVKVGAEKYIDSASKKKIKLDDITSAIKGDATIAVMKVYEFSEEDSVTQAMNGMQLFAAGTIKDKEKFAQLTARLQAEKDSSKDRPAKKMKPLIQSADSIFVVSLSQMAGEKFLQSSAPNEEMKRLIDPYKNHPSAFIIDLKTIFSFAMQGMAKNKSEQEVQRMSEAVLLTN